MTTLNAVSKPISKKKVLNFAFISSKYFNEFAVLIPGHFGVNFLWKNHQTHF